MSQKYSGFSKIIQFSAKLQKKCHNFKRSQALDRELLEPLTNQAQKIGL